MSMKKFCILFAAITIAAVSTAMAQSRSYEALANIDKKTQANAVCIDVSANVKDAKEVMEKLLKNAGLKGKCGKILSYEKIAFSEISTDYINMYIGFEAKSKNKNNPVTKVNVFVQKGISTDYESSRSDVTLVTNLKYFLDSKYTTAINNNNLEQSIHVSQKDVETKKKEVEKLKKDITVYEKNIKKAEENIKKANSDIDKLSREIDVLNQSIKQQNSSIQR